MLGDPEGRREMRRKNKQKIGKWWELHANLRACARLTDAADQAGYQGRTASVDGSDTGSEVGLLCI